MGKVCIHRDFEFDFFVHILRKKLNAEKTGSYTYKQQESADAVKAGGFKKHRIIMDENLVIIDGQQHGTFSVDIIC